jgi:hypothetical protein
MRLRFPLKGLHRGFPTVQQPDGTTFSCSNVRVFDCLDDRARGGQRPGWNKWGNGDQIGSSEQPVVAMAAIGSIR